MEPKNVGVKSVMYGVGSTGKVQDGQHVFVSIRRDSEKTILTADGSIVNSMVKFPQAQEQVHIASTYTGQPIGYASS